MYKNKAIKNKKYSLALVIFIVIRAVFSCPFVSYASDEWMWPVPGSYIINSLDCYPDGSSHNQGQCIDIGNNGYSGNVRLDILSSTSGTVETVVNTYEDRPYNDGSYGNYIVINSGSYNVLYAHFKSISVVKGQTVKAGTVLGKMGTSGQSTGVHLHMQVYPVGTRATNNSVCVFDKFKSKTEYVARFMFLKGLESKSKKYGIFIKQNYKTLKGSYYCYSKPVVLDTAVWISNGTLSLKVGQTFSLWCSVRPENADYKDVSWTSSDLSVASVDANGKVLAKKAGTATVTVKSHSGYKASCRVTVTGKALTVGKNTYTDVTDNDWFYDEVKFVIEKGIFNGTSNSTFSPKMIMTRAMFVSVIARMSGENMPYTYSRFLDIDMTKYYGKYVAWANDKGIVSGISDDMFDPDSQITREQMCTVIIRYMKYKGKSLPLPTIDKFADDGNISDWAYSSVYICKALGVVSGKGNGYFDPRSGATRAEVATMLAALSKII